jgi:transposase
MEAYSLDLRQRILDAIDQHIDTYQDIAETFGVHESSRKAGLLRQRRATGTLSPLPHGGGAIAKLDDAHLTILGQLVAEFPDATLEELRQHLKTKIRIKVSVSTIWRGLDTLSLTRKKSPASRRKPTQKNVPPFGKSNDDLQHRA